MTHFTIPIFVSLILKRLKAAGHQSYIVGGAIRDMYLKRHITDWDVATSASPKEIKTIFHDKKHFSLKHDTVTIVDSGLHFEVTTFRGKKKCLDEDLRCRDFTINAMAYDHTDNEILDPYEGKKDITRKLIRATADPEARFKEDPLRLLRAVRLSTELGFRIESGTQKALVNMAPLIHAAAPERIREELMKVLMSQKPSTGFNLMVRTGLLKNFFPEILEGYLKRQNAYHRYTIFKHIMKTVDTVEPVPVLRLTAMLHDIAKPRVRKKEGGRWQFYGHEKVSALLAGEIMGKLRFSKDMIRNVTNLIRNHMIGYNSRWGNGAVRRLIRRVGQDQIMDLLAFYRADIFAHGLYIHELDLVSELEERIKDLIKDPIVSKTRNLAIDGHKVMEALGLSPGPEVGKILKDLMEKVIDNPDLNCQEQLLSLLEQMKSSRNLYT